ncbi:MAG: hypothetical protein ACM3SQ_17075 [Betaproteobacteria bacterium]
MTLESDHGAALVVALLAMLLMSALGVAIVLITMSETLIAGRFSHTHEALDAADAAVERAAGDLLTVPDWNPLLDGSVRSGFVDGAPDGTRTTDAGTVVNLSAIRNVANCGHPASCTAAEMDASTAERPWGTNNPRWQLYAYGPLEDLLPTPDIESPFYVVVMIGDDPAETDGDPLHDGIGSRNPGAGVIALRAEAFGPRGVHQVVEMTVARVGVLERVADAALSDEQNHHASAAPVQGQGQGLTLQRLPLASGGLR